ncbi:V-type ATP synthase subunit D [Methylomarinum sp. Ch1-1]|uniref:V-type ATP synthase subunit D n=1 Tax=Methylomarinum roseum TaxID=3067653 RepID=A0AAU7NQJ6_9GAMM|nr:V-type ATP synthase subunit D [Methylomarinum sp. Ch1-1]MDP4520785.1 V-type ATP synthase subunit D [Methylomarinum sp. Ch1-1]
MSRLQYSKASLHKQSALLKRYRQYLPSLDLKRQQLIAERAKAMKQMRATQQQIEQTLQFVRDNLPMLADENIKLAELVAVNDIRIEQENRVGVEIPRLADIDISEKAYSFFCKPHWVDLYVRKLKEMLTLKIQLQVERRRLELLDHAVKKVTQRVNLFDKILIPKAEKNIRKIRIFLSDSERAAVIRAKITKQKRLRHAS